MASKLVFPLEIYLQKIFNHYFIRKQEIKKKHIKTLKMIIYQKDLFDHALAGVAHRL